MILKTVCFSRYLTKLRVARLKVDIQWRRVQRPDQE
jgi:hypothetical protein